MRTSRFSRCALLGCLTVTVACSQTTELSRFQYTPSVEIVRDRRVSPLRYFVAYNFGGAPDGAHPSASLIGPYGKTFYGTTWSGGTYTAGTVFSITTGRKENVLYSFGNTSTDGRNPYAGLIDVRGTLYGTSIRGGVYACFSGTCGTVFSVTTSGKEKVLYSFGKGTDGSNPRAGLIDVAGTFYGTTYHGGKYCASFGGCGTVFSITTKGKEKVLHSFRLGSDGAYPLASLIDVGGTLYGTTYQGGTYEALGTVFRISTGGKKYKVLHSFGKGTDGNGLRQALSTWAGRFTARRCSAASMAGAQSSASRRAARRKYSTASARETVTDVSSTRA